MYVNIHMLHENVLIQHIFIVDFAQINSKKLLYKNRYNV